MAPTPPLIIAAKARNIVECRRLIETGEANVNADRDGSGWTALHWASNRGYLDIAELLVSSGADMNIGTNSGMTALHFASYNGYLDIAELLVSSGACMTIGSSMGMVAA